MNLLPENEECENFKAELEKKTRAQEISSESEAESEPEQKSDQSDSDDEPEPSRFFFKKSTKI